ncbi:MAG: hypothetical protein WC071_10630 [Victivallaceae bacterium]
MSTEKANMVSANEIAQHFGVCKDTIYTWLAESKMPTRARQLFNHVDKLIENDGATQRKNRVLR